MNFFRLFAVLFFILTFSARPADKAIVPAATETFFKKEPTADMIPWGSHNRLTWEDFLCEPKRGTDAVASTSTSLGISYQLANGKLNYDITCHFNKEKSWGLLKTDYILAHEQGHFDITEIFARKLYEALQNYEFNKRTFKKDISAIYQSIVKQKEEFQKAYDGETDHSRKRNLQYDWLEKIEILLAETEVYASYP